MGEVLKVLVVGLQNDVSWTKLAVCCSVTWRREEEVAMLLLGFTHRKHRQRNKKTTKYRGVTKGGCRANQLIDHDIVSPSMLGYILQVEAGVIMGNCWQVNAISIITII